MYAKINRNLTDTGERQSQVNIIPPEDLHPAKSYWVPVIEEETDTSTGPDTITSEWVETVEVDRLLRARTIRDKTQEELDAEDQERVEEAFNLSGTDRALLQLIFELIKAMKTGNRTFFDSVIDVKTFKKLAEGLIR